MSKIFAGALSLAFILLGSCGSSTPAGSRTSNPTQPEAPLQAALKTGLKDKVAQLQGNMGVFFTDVPADNYLKILVTFSALEIQSSDGVWHQLSSPLIGQAIDLLLLQNNATALASDSNLDATLSYVNMRVTVSKVDLVSTEGVTTSANIGKGVAEFSIRASDGNGVGVGAAGSPLIIVIDINADKSLNSDAQPTFDVSGSVVLITRYNNGDFIDIKNNPESNISNLAPFSLSYSGFYLATINIAATLSPVVIGGPVVSCSISPNLPAGLSFNTTTCAISGAGTVVSSGNYSVTATDAVGQISTATVVVTVQPVEPSPTFTVGGTISLAAPATLILQNNLGNNIAVSASGTFVFPIALAINAAYSVTVLNQPIGQLCTVTNGAGKVSSNITNVAVSCVLSYTLVGEGPIANLPNISVLASDGTNLYAGTKNGSLYKSTNGGIVWTQLGGGFNPNGTSISSVVVNSTTAYIGLSTSGVVYSTSTTPGGSWSTVGAGLTGVGVYLAISSDGQTLYAGTSTGTVYSSPTNSPAWTSLGTPEGSSIAALAVADGTLFATTGNIWRYNGTGTDWSLIANTNNDFTVMIGSGTNLYAGGGVPGAPAGFVFQFSSSVSSCKVGANCGTQIGTSPDGSPIKALAVNVVSSSTTVYTATGNGTVLSSPISNTNSAWATVGTPNTIPANALTISSLAITTGTSSLYAGTNAGIYSTGLATTAAWTATTNIPNEANALWVSVDSSGTIYALTNVGLFSSSSGGSWSSIANSLLPDSSRPTFAPVMDNDTVYQMGLKNVYSLSNDVWTAIANVPLTSSVSGTAPVIASGTVYVATTDNDVWSSTTTNGTWASTGFHAATGSSFSAVSLAVTPDNQLYVGTHSNNVWTKTPEPHGCWSKLGNGALPDTSGISSIAVNPTTKTVYVSTNGGKVYTNSSTGTSPWQLVGSNTSVLVKVNQLLLDSSVLYAATNAGIFTSTSGGDWVGPLGGAKDVFFIAFTPNLIYITTVAGASVYAIGRST